MDNGPDSCKWLLKPIQILRLQESIEIGDDGVTLGRSETNTVVIPEAGFPYVSSNHASIRMVDGTPVVEDLGSKNGTLVNGEPVERRELQNGDILQLGNMGPRFAVVCADRLTDTLPTVAVPADGRKTDFTQSGIVKIKKALGIPRDADLHTFVKHRGRRARAVLWSVLVLVAASAAIALWVLSERSSAEAARSKAQAERLEALTGQLERQLSDTRAEVDRREAAWHDERQRLIAETATLATKIGTLEAEAGASATRISELRQQLSDARQKLELYDPVTFERAQLREVKRVTRAVVFIENNTYFRHIESGRLLHARPEEEELGINLEDEGEPFVLDSTGSGFCVSQDGWILTNAHVVIPETRHGPFGRRFTTMFEAEVELDVVFSGTSERIPAVKVEAVLDGDVDMALLKIEPFEGMPYIDGIDLDLPVPEAGTEVYLSGFPLGTMALQQGETVIASTFKGILSRVVRPFLQVDAAVHPGNSGGPVMDTQGRILGIATRVQKTPGGPYAPTIGYITPVAELHRVWPPPGRRTEEDRERAGPEKDPK